MNKLNTEYSYVPANPKILIKSLILVGQLWIFRDRKTSSNFSPAKYVRESQLR